MLPISEEEYASNIGLDYIAQEVYLTPSYLSMLFKKERNTGLVHYINDYRLEKAKEMLRNTNMRVVDISSKVGYESLAYFYSIFKKKYGNSPRNTAKAERMAYVRFFWRANGALFQDFGRGGVRRCDWL